MTRRTPLAAAVLTAFAFPAACPLAAYAQQNEQPGVTLPTVTVTAPGAEETATGPVAGYRAKRSATATKTDTPLHETPQSISVVPREQFEDQGASNLQDTMRYTAGVYANTFGFDNRGDWARIRGTDFAQYQDGLRMLFGFYNNVRPDLWSLERVEIIKGPASVLYGQGSFGGLVNLVSKRPLDTEQRQIDLTVGNHNRKQLAVDLTGPLNEEGTLLYRLIALGRDSDTQVNHVPDDRRLLAPSLTWKPNAGTSVRLYASMQKDESGSSVGFFPWQGMLLPAPFGRIPTDTFISEPSFDEFTADQKALGVEASWKLGERLTLRHHIRKSESEVTYRSLYSRFGPRPTLNPDGRTVNRTIYAAANEADALTADTQLEAKWKSGRLESTMLAGWDVQRVTLGNAATSAAAPAIDVYAPVYGNFTPVTPGAQTITEQRQTGLYLQYQGKWADRWIGVVGLRRDHAKSDSGGAAASRLDSSATTGRLGIAYAHPSGWSPYASWSESFLPVTGVNAFGQAYQPQTAEQAEIGVKYQAPNGGLSFTASVYDIRETNRRTPDPANPLNQVQTGEARSKGVELEAVAALTKAVDVVAAYSHNDARVIRSNTAAELGRRLASVPGNQASLWSRYKLAVGNGLVSIGAGVRYVGSSWDGRDVLETPDYTLFDAMLGYETGPWKASLTINNLADKVHITTCINRGDCYYGMRRTVMANLRYTF